MSEEKLQRIETLLEQTNERIDKLEQTISTQFKEFDLRIDTYQKASQQVVNLAFGLILTATAAIVIPVVFNR